MAKHRNGQKKSDVKSSAHREDVQRKAKTNKLTQLKRQTNPADVIHQGSTSRRGLNYLEGLLAALSNGDHAVSLAKRHDPLLTEGSDQWPLSSIRKRSTLGW